MNDKFPTLWLDSAKLFLDNEIMFLAQEDVDLAKKVYAHIFIQKDNYHKNSKINALEGL